MRDGKSKPKSKPKPSPANHDAILQRHVDRLMAAIRTFEEETPPANDSGHTTTEPKKE